MPSTENDRLNQQQPVLKNPSLPDHNRTADTGMHEVHFDEDANDEAQLAELEEEELAAPDQEFGQILRSGLSASQGKFPEDPNNWLTSDPDPGMEDDPESRGESLPDIIDGGNQ